MNIAICDDNKLIVESIGKSIMDYKYFNDDIKIYKFYSGKEFIEAFEKIKFDIVYMDIELKRSEIMEKYDNGIEVAKYVKEARPMAALIFVSDFNTYFEKMARVEPLAFVYKPFTKEEILRELERAILRKMKLNTCSMSVKYRGINIRINLKEIKYFYSKGRQIYIHKDELDQGDFSTYMKLDDLEKRLKEEYPNYVRVNSRFLVNKDFITDWNEQNVTIGSSNKIINIGKKYAAKCITALH